MVLLYLLLLNITVGAQWKSIHESLTNSVIQSYEGISKCILILQDGIFTNPNLKKSQLPVIKLSFQGESKNLEPTLQLPELQLFLLIVNCKLEVEIYLQDSAVFQLQIDDKLFETKYIYDQNSQEPQTCPEQTLNIVRFNQFIQHNFPNPVLFLTSKNTQENFWGFRNFIMRYLPCAQGCFDCQGETFCQEMILIAQMVNGDIEGWKEESQGPRVVDCLHVELLSPSQTSPGGILSKNFNGLPPHFTILIKLQYWILNLVQQPQFKIKMDNDLILDKQINSQGINQLQVCDDQQKQLIENFYYLKDHFMQDLQLTALSTTNTIWGLRDLEIFVAQCSQNCQECFGPEINECTACDRTHFLQDNQCIEQSGWYVWDEYFMGNHRFNDLEGWEIEGADKFDVVSECGNSYLIGGHCIFGENAIAKKRMRIPKHSKIRIQFQLWKIDKFNDEIILVKVNNQEIEINQGENNEKNKLEKCGDDKTKEYVVEVDQILVNDQQLVEIEISSKNQVTSQQSCQGSWGFRSFVLEYESSEDCLMFYDQCDYQGQVYEFCKQSERFNKESINFAIKSVYIPQSVDLLRSLKDIKLISEFDESVQCIEYMH